MSDPWLSVRAAAPADGADAAADEARRRRQLRGLPNISIDLGPSHGPKISASGVALPNDLEVIGTIGEGGMGTVLLARQHALARDVAVKTVKDGAPSSAVMQLLAEGVISGGLEHPGIVPVHALGLDDNRRPLLVMKRVEGVAWSELLDNPENPAWDDWAGTTEDRLVGNLEVLMQVCNAVHFANSRGVLHRDIKPSNVLIGRYGDVYLADWGVALRLSDLSQAEPFSGTPLFAAPEMVSGQGLGVHTDVYLLGSTLHQIITGSARHAADTALGALANAVRSEPYDYPEHVPAELAALANRATAHDPELRPKNAAEFRRAIADFLLHRSATALSASAGERLAMLRVLLADYDETDTEAGRRIDELAAATHFGLSQALSLWQDNAEAQSGLAELEALLEQRRSRAAALAHIARDQDPRHAARQRVVLLGVLGTLVVGMGAVGLAAILSNSNWTAREMSGHGLIVFAIVCIAVFAQRRQLRQSAMNRSAAVLTLTATGLMAFGRVLSWYGGEPAAQILFHDAVVLAAVAAAASLTLSARMLPIIGVMLINAVICRVWPQYATLSFSASAVVAAALLGYVTWSLIASASGSAGRVPAGLPTRSG